MKSKYLVFDDIYTIVLSVLCKSIINNRLILLEFESSDTFGLLLVDMKEYPINIITFIYTLKLNGYKYLNRKYVCLQEVIFVSNDTFKK